DVIAITAGTATLTPAQQAGLKILPSPTQQTDFTLTVSASSIDGAAAPAITTGTLRVKIPLPPVLNAPDPIRDSDVDRHGSLSGNLGGVAGGFLGLRANTFTSDMPSVWEAGAYNNRVINLPIPLHPIVFVEVTIAREQGERVLSDLRLGGTDVGSVAPSEINSVSIGSNLGMDPTVYVKHAVDLAESDRLFVQARTLGRDGRTSLSSDNLLPHNGIFALDPASLLSRQAPGASFAEAPVVPQSGIERRVESSNPPEDVVPAVTVRAAPELALERGARSFSEQLRSAAKRGVPRDAMHVAYPQRSVSGLRT
ncbi:MAG: hypothetical protein WCO67_16545, partial [Betaproteobacteria bacterium]